MNSKYDQIYQNNMIENMMNSNKKINSRNAPNDANYFINNDNNCISKSFNSIDKYGRITLEVWTIYSFFAQYS